MLKIVVLVHLNSFLKRIRLVKMKANESYRKKNIYSWLYLLCTYIYRLLPLTYILNHNFISGPLRLIRIQSF